jgi:hypothetical protein
LRFQVVEQVTFGVFDLATDLHKCQFLAPSQAQHGRLRNAKVIHGGIFGVKRGECAHVHAAIFALSKV